MHYEDGTLVRRNSERSPICHGGQTNESRNAMKGTRIVVLDGFTANPGDLDWNPLAELGMLTVHDRTPPDLVVQRSSQAEIVLTNKVVLSRETIAALPGLKYIGVLATGYNVVDVEAAAERGIPVANVPAYGTSSVAQMVFAHIFHLVNNVAGHSARVHEGAWSRSYDFCFWDTPQIELAGKTIGLVGLGKIGLAVAKAARAFDMRVVGYKPSGPAGIPDGIGWTDLRALFRESDIVSLHCPATRENQGFVNAELLALMKPGAFLINTSRGALIDEAALAVALNRGAIAGAGLDVLAMEPANPANPLLTARNCHITPHIAWATREARARLLRVSVENVQGFLRGQWANVVNGTGMREANVAGEDKSRT